MSKSREVVAEILRMRDKANSNPETRIKRLLGLLQKILDFEIYKWPGIGECPICQNKLPKHHKDCPYPKIKMELENDQD